MDGEENYVSIFFVYLFTVGVRTLAIACCEDLYNEYLQSQI